MITWGHSDPDTTDPGAGRRAARTDMGETMGEDPDSTTPVTTPVTAARSVVAVDVQAADWRRLSPGVEEDLRETAEAAVRAARDPMAPACVEVSLLLADDATVRALNREYRGRDAPTNVLAFPQNESPDTAALGPVLLGDVVLALETVLREASAQDKSALDHSRHLVVHGILHLLGFDHQTAAAAAEMERRETAILAGLGIADPYAATAVTDTSTGAERP